MNANHILKTWPEPFQAILDGRKNYEIRKNDRDFKINDILYLTEFDPATDGFTGRGRLVRVTYMTNGGSWGLPKDLCVMSIKSEPLEE